MERSPKNATFHYNLGNEYAKRGYYAPAILEYEKSLSLRPDNQWAYINLADAYRKMSSYDKAIENYKKAIAMPERDNYIDTAYAGLRDAYAKKTEQRK